AHAAGPSGDLRAPPAWTLAEPVEPRAVVPEDLLLGRLAHALEAEERLDRSGIGRVVVRPVRGDHDVVVAHRWDRVAYYVLVRIDRDPAVAAEGLARAHGQMEPLVVAELLDALVERPEPPGHPAAAALEERRLEPGVALEDAAGQEASESHHLLERVRDRVRHHEIVHEAPAEVLL